MKKYINILLFTVFAISSYGQSLPDGINMMQYQRYQSAIAIFKTIVQQDATNVNAAYWLGQAYINNKEIDEAITHYSNYSKSNHKILTAGLAQAYFIKGDKVKAENLMLRIITEPADIQEEDLAIAFGKTYAASKQIVKAESYFLRGHELNKSNPYDYVLLGNNALKRGDGTAAFNYYNSAKKIDSNYAPQYYRLAKIFISQKAPDLYLPLLQKTIEKDSLYAPAWYELYRYAYYNDKEKVKKYYAHYLELSDKTEKQEYQLLVLDYNQRKYPAVIARSKKILKDEETDVPVDIYRYVAFSYYQAKNLPEAYNNMLHFMQVQDSSKISSSDIYLTAQFAARQKIMDSMAISYIIEGYNADTSSSNRKFYAATLANFYLINKDNYHATLWKERLLPLKGYDKVDMYRIVVSWYALNELNRADSLISEFLKLYPKEYKGIYMQAGIQSKIDSSMQTGAAIPYFEDFIRKGSNKKTSEYQSMIKQSYNYLGSYYLAKKEYSNALIYYNSLLKLKPNERDLKKTVAGLRKYMKDSKEYNEKKNANSINNKK